MKNLTISKLRILATFLVVIGHAIIIYDPSWGIFKTVNNNIALMYIKQFINLIQMPIFMFISGYLFYSSYKKGKYLNVFSVIKNKFIRLILPFFFVAALWMIPIRLIIGLTETVKNGYFMSLILAIIGKSSGHLWFLPTLYFIFIISYIIIKCIKINEIYILFFLLLLSMVSSAFPSIFYISLIVKYLCYFYFGFVVAKSNLSFVCKDRIILVTLFVFFSIFSIFFIKNSINYIIQPICGCLGTLSVYSICNNNKYNTLLNIIETNSFTIYLLHPPIVYIIFNEFANIKPILLVTLAIILSIIIPIFIAKILIKCNLSYLIGEK